MATFIANLLEGFAQGTVDKLVTERNQKIDREKRENELVGQLLTSGNYEALGIIDPARLERIGITPEMRAGLSELAQRKQKQQELAQKTQNVQLQTAELGLTAAQRREASRAALPADKQEVVDFPELAQYEIRKEDLAFRRDELKQRLNVATTEEAGRNRRADLSEGGASARASQDIALRREALAETARAHRETEAGRDRTETRQLDALNLRKETELIGQANELAKQKANLFKSFVKTKVGGSTVAVFKKKEEADSAASELNSYINQQVAVENAVLELRGKPPVQEREQYIVVPVAESGLGKFLPGQDYTIRRTVISGDGTQKISETPPATGSEGVKTIQSDLERFIQERQKVRTK